MKTKLLWIAPALVVAAFLCTAFGGGENTDYPSGSPGGYTGSPGDGHNCTSCHNGSASSVTGWITSNIPADGYTPGTTYTITATATGSGNKGFEISPQNLSGGLLGTLTPGSGNKHCNSNKAITHSSAVGGSSATWTFTWTAPAAGTGAVTFYGAFVVTKPVTKLTTMVVNEAVSVPLTANATATPSSVCAGQSSQLNVTAAGGSGSYTYSWTSDPAGFTSGAQNPTVSPSVTTAYTVVVNDGVNNATASVTVTVTQPPQAFAGNDTTYCKDVAGIPLNGSASNYASLLWTTSGDGTFSTTSALVSTYFPGTNDKTTGWVNLYLSASPVSPCANNAASARHIILDPCTGINTPVGASAGFLLSPNPSNGITFITLSGAGNSADITIYDNQGRKAFSTVVTDPANHSRSLDLSGLSKGIYVVKVQSENWIRTQKLILQ